MDSESFLYNHIEEYCYDYINKLYIAEVVKNNNIELEEFEISMFIEDQYPKHKSILQEQLLNDIEKNYSNLIKLYHKISKSIFKDDNYNKGILYEKICNNKLYKRNVKK